MEKNLLPKKISPFKINKIANLKLAMNQFKTGFAPTLLDIDTKVINQITTSTHLLEMALPVNNKESIELELYAVNIFAPEFKVVNSKGDEIPYTKGLHFHGRIKGDNNSIAAISITNGEVSGLISDKTGDRMLKKQPNNNIYSLYYEQGLVNQIPFECSMAEEPITSTKNARSSIVDGVVSCKVVNIHMEADYPLYVKYGSQTATIAFVTNLFNEIAAIYKKDLIGIQMSHIKIWNTPDNYENLESKDLLNRMKYNLGANYNGNIAVLLSGRTYLTGGEALDFIYSCDRENAVCYGKIPSGNGYSNGSV